MTTDAAARQWIAVEARLPADGEPVLIFLPQGNRGLEGYEVAQWWSGKDDPSGKGGCWWTNGGPNGGADMDEWIAATHWMPLDWLPPPAVSVDAQENVEAK